jgi:hypothetical protein
LRFGETNARFFFFFHLPTRRVAFRAFEAVQDLERERDPAEREREREADLDLERDADLERDLDLDLERERERDLDFDLSRSPFVALASSLWFSSTASFLSTSGFLASLSTDLERDLDLERLGERERERERERDLERDLERERDLDLDERDLEREYERDLDRERLSSVTRIRRPLTSIPSHFFRAAFMSALVANSTTLVKGKETRLFHTFQVVNGTKDRTMDYGCEDKEFSRVTDGSQNESDYSTDCMLLIPPTSELRS